MILPDDGHDPVLLAETLDGLAVRPGTTIVDCTLGRAGHGLAIAQRLGTAGTLIGLDADPRNLAFAQKRLVGAECEVRLFHANFAELDDVLSAVGIVSVDGILADLGISTNQLGDAAYGLSFSADMPLDMRLDPRIEKTAADYVNRMGETELANVLYQLAQERYSRRIATKIAQARQVSPITSTGRLAELVRAVVPAGGFRQEKIDTATRTFMALRMLVNGELDNLKALLDRGWRALEPGGRMAVISFHSGEDRLVKQAFRGLEASGHVVAISRKPIVPTQAECSDNPRSRSAKLRVIERTAKPS